jgi:hypothetical protein
MFAAKDRAMNNSNIAISILVNEASVLMLGLIPSTAGTRARTMGIESRYKGVGIMGL